MTTDLNNRTWKPTTLGSYFRIKHGFAFKGEFFSDSGPYVLLTPGNFREEGGLKLKGDKEKYYTSDFPPKFLLRRGDLLVAMTDLKQDAPIIGSAAFITEDESFLHNQRLGKIIDLDEEKMDKHFLFYLFNTANVREQIKASATGSTVRHTAPDRIYSVKIELPPLSTQRKIAYVLSVYDDLIGNNVRRIGILEEMAQRIYREWFVHFRFPGHEKVGMVESELGPIPEGWEVRKASDALLINPRTKVPREGEKPFVPMGSLSNNSMLISDIELRSGNSGSKFKNGDTLFARITPSLENGKTGYVQFLPSEDYAAFGSTEFIVLRSRTLCSEYVYLLSRSNEFRDNAIKSMTGASGRQRVQERCFDNFLLAHPDPKTLEEFSSVVFPFFQNVDVLAKKNANLRQTRDLLLPKLISGEVDVEHMNVGVPK